MTETLIGIAVILGSGLIGREALVKEQTSLKTTLHHLEAYQDVIGLLALISGIFGLYHSIATGLSNLYTPIYWLFWTSSNMIAVAIGLTLCLPLFYPRLQEEFPTLSLLCSYIEQKVNHRPSTWCWLGLILGSWRALFPWLAA